MSVPTPFRPLLPALAFAALAAAQTQPPTSAAAPLVLVREGRAVSTMPTDFALPELRPDREYSVLATLADPSTTGMVRVELFDPTGMPTGKVLHAGDPDLQFVYRPRLGGTSVLRIGRSGDREPVHKAIDDATRAVPRDLSIVALQQDDAALASAMEQGDGEARLDDTAPYSGRSALRVKSTAKLARNVPGWGFRIVEDPAPGEYRWLRFAVRAADTAGAMVALAAGGEFGGDNEAGRRYRMGATPSEWSGHGIAAEPASDWLVVTRDLFADAGAFTLTGLGVVPFGGTMWLDHVYLARTREALDKVTPETVRQAMARGSSDGLELLEAAPPAPVAPATGSSAAFADAVAWRVEIRELQLSPAEQAMVESEPNDQWNYADEIVLGTDVRGSADDIEFLDNTHEGEVGWDWFRFRWAGEPQLVFFALDCPDRDVVATMQLFVQNEVGRLVQYKRGKDPTEVRHDNQDASIAGWKFLSRVIADGTYWLRVKANSPSYVLRTTLHDVPPYIDPRQAVRTAAEYAVLAGDSFFANVPRGGAVRTRADLNTDETSRCFACHAGHYPLIANLTAAQHGYRVTDRPEFRNLIDRVYNAGAPLYGHDGATWARFDLAPTTGIARVGTMLVDFERDVSRRPTDAISGPARFCELVYGDRTELPQQGDRTVTGNYEFDGNRPISDVRVAREAWRLFDEMARRTGDERWQRLARHLQDLMPTARLKDNEDHAERILWLLAMDPQRYAAEIGESTAKLLAEVHDDGGWWTAEYATNLQVNDVVEASKLDNKKFPSLTFFTAQAAYALDRAGMPAGREGRQVVDRAVRLLLQRQLEFGGWMDGQGELFRTAYLETKWAVILLASRYPEVPAAAEAATLRTGAGAVAAALRAYDTSWQLEAPTRLEDALAGLRDPEPVLRTAAVQAVQRLCWNQRDDASAQRAVTPLAAALGDPCKAVALGAAQALRALGNQGLGRDELLRALGSDDVRTRRAAARVFVRQFWSLARDGRCLDALLQRLDDADFVVRLRAVKGLQQWWYRIETGDGRQRIVDALLRRGRVEQRPEVTACLTKGLYSICDENTSEFYGNDLRVLATAQARDTARRAREEVVERDLGRRLAEELRDGPRSSRLLALRALGLRIARGAPNGNDTDDVALFDADAAAPLAAAVQQALGDGDPEVREWAAWACTAVRKHADAGLLAALLRATGDEDARVRTAALRALDVIEVHDQDLPAHGVAFRFVHLDEGASARTEDATCGLLRWLRRDASSQRVEFVPELIRLLASEGDLELRQLALQDLEWGAEAGAAAARDAIWGALEDQEPALRTEAEVQIERAHARQGFLVQGDHRWRFVARALQTSLAEQHERAVRFALWQEHDTPWPVLLPELGKLLGARRPRLRADAVTLILRAREQGQDTGALLQQCLALPDAPLRERAALALGLDPASVPAPKQKLERVDSPLDFDAFAAFVHPILMRPATTGARSCVECHNQQQHPSGFVLVPAEDGAPSDEELIANYNAVVAYVDTAQPTDSPLLRKPLNPDRAIGALHGISHGGGVSWSEPSDPDFRAVLEWAKGQKLDRAEQFHFDQFYQKVVPIFTDLGPTGDACWDCHNTHNTLFMPEPADGERYTPQEARMLLDFVMRTVDLRSPESSLVLQKPLHELDNPFRERDRSKPTHGGGIRWPEGKRSWQYRDLLDWIERVAGKR